MTRCRSLALSGIFLGCLLAGAVQAQSLKFQPQDSDQPMEVTADNGLELQQDNKRAIARGNARLVQGDVSVHADELTADYRTRADGENEIYRIFASGNVTMKSASETATGDAAIYDFDKAVLVLEGSVVRLVNDDGSVTANRALQYWSNERVAVAEGSAVAVDKQRHRISGDKLIAFFREGASTGGGASKNKSLSSAPARGEIIYVQAFGNVRMETPKETIRSERGTYNIEKGIATLDGSVKITRDKNQLGGGFAVVNVKGGSSRIFTNAAQAGMARTTENVRVKGLIAPKTQRDAAPAPAPSAGASAAGKRR